MANASGNGLVDASPHRRVQAYVGQGQLVGVFALAFAVSTLLYRVVPWSSVSAPLLAVVAGMSVLSAAGPIRWRPAAGTFSAAVAANMLVHHLAWS